MHGQQEILRSVREEGEENHQPDRQQDVRVVGAKDSAEVLEEFTLGLGLAITFTFAVMYS